MISMNKPAGQFTSAEPRFPPNPVLLFCWHLRVGSYREVDEQRIRAYAAFFYNTYLKPHLHNQECWMNSACHIDPAVLRRARVNHRSIHRLFHFNGDVKRSLGILEEKLEAHIRLEKNELFDYFRCLPDSVSVGKHELNKTFFDLELVPQVNRWADRYWALK